jgi:hypothetical protein
MSCRFGVIEELSGAVETGVCIRRVRECAETDVCNGLDDDCNGVIDDAGCELITACNDDAACGAFVCTAPPNQPSTVCTPPIATAQPYFAPCTADDQCQNALCSTGFCSPFCRARGDEATECGGMLACARSMGSRTRPPHNICQEPCNSPTHCEAPTQCVWRDVHQPASFDHVAVCSLLDPERLPTGEPCTGHSIEGDDMCQHGICLGDPPVCTRICGGPGTDCSDVGQDFACETFELRDGSVFDICRRQP